MICRDSYFAVCSGVCLLTNPTPGAYGVLINFMEGEKVPTREPLEEGWRVVGIILSPADARALGENLLRYAEQSEKP